MRPREVTDMTSLKRPDFFCFYLLLLIVTAAAAHAAAPREEVFQFTREGSGLTLHKEMFMLPATLSSRYHNAQTEAVFQISAKHRVFGTPFYFAYTQISFWQAYDHKNSAPFRETDYNPELFYRSDRTDLLSGRVGADIGFEHESNGQRVPLSRSWNLLYAAPYWFREGLLIHLKLRYRIPEEKKTDPNDAVGDDNPDITDYLGYADLDVYYRFPWNHAVHVMVRGNWNTGKGGMVLMYSWPIPKGKYTYFCLRFSHGYGESLVDYNRKLTRLGFGLMFGR
jgi:phospholipase A1